MRTDNEYDRFPIAKRGYDPHAVEAFLEVAAADNDRMLNEAAARIASLESEVEEAKRQEEAVHLTILAATKAKDDMLEAARHQAAESVAKGHKEGDRIVTEARMQAFQLVTGARKEAETIVGEARAEAAAVARVEGIVEVPDDAATERERDLQRRIDEMQQVVAAMEVELAARPAFSEAVPADDATVEVAPAPAQDLAAPVEVIEDPAPPEPAAEITRTEPAAATNDEHIEIVVTDTPPAEPAVEQEPLDTEIAVDDVAVTVEADVQPATADSSVGGASSITDERTPEAVRRSFYSRRSAKLPRIGAEGGRDAMAAMAGLRTNFVAADAAADAGPEDTPAFEAV
ncbi:MAG: DivIVA domain-containing protein [Acidimicrobiia bacterium]